MAHRTVIRIAGVLFALLLVACSTRDPANPLDPENPDTGGDPRWLVALADDAAVDLEWDVPRFDDLREVRLLDAAGAVRWSGPAGGGTWRDAPVANGASVAYRLELALAGGRSILLREESATPGPQIVWALDADTGLLHRLTPDGRRSRARHDAPDASSARVDGATGSILLVDFYARRVRLLDRDGEPLWTAGEFVRPLGSLRVDGGWWIADPGSGAVTLLDDEGARAAADTSFTFPAGFAPADSGQVWVVDGGGLVARFDRERGILAAYDGLASPDVAAASSGGGVWVADSGGQGLVHLDRNGEVLGVFPDLVGIVALTSDPVLPGAVWIADRRRRAVALLDGDGIEVARFGGLLAPSSISVAPDGGEIWVADPSLGAVVRFGRDGGERSRSIGLSGPVSIAVAFRPAGR